MNTSAPAEVLAIVPARGGSKGIPRKNVRLLGGRPLISYAIQAAQNARSVTRVVVSTEDDEIAATARRFGAEVIQRPVRLSGDDEPSESALLHALHHLYRQELYRPDVLVFLQCTAPLTLPEDIDGTVTELVSQQADSAVAVVPFHGFIWRRDKAGYGMAVNHDRRLRPMRQARKSEFIEAGAVYAMRVEGFLKEKHRFFGKTALYVMPYERWLEIDEPRDLAVAEKLVQWRLWNEQVGSLPDAIEAVVFDFDGVFTDNRVLIVEDGQEAVICSRSDGWGIAQLKRLGIPLLVLSTEKNPVVAARCAKLGIECRSGVDDKCATLRAWMESRGLNAAQVIYVGNDVNDMAAMQTVGCPVAVADAHGSVRAMARIVLGHPGGRGAIRELSDMILARRGWSGVYEPLDQSVVGYR